MYNPILDIKKPVAWLCRLFCCSASTVFWYYSVFQEVQAVAEVMGPARARCRGGRGEKGTEGKREASWAKQLGEVEDGEEEAMEQRDIV
jgi:hypothetical protein